MRVAIPTFEGRVAPRLEGAPEVRVVDPKDAEAEPRVLPGLSHDVAGWLGLVQAAAVQWVLCGALSPALLSALEARGIQVMMGVAGEVDAVVEALRDGRLQLGVAVPFSVWPGPGPGPGRCCGLGPFRRGSGFGRRDGRVGGPFGGPGRGGGTLPGRRGSPRANGVGPKGRRP